MSFISSDSELLRCFREIDRPDVEPPGKLVFPFEVAPCVAWSAGPRSFLLFRDRPTGAPRGIVFHRSTAAMPAVASMCEWCHAVREHGGVRLLTAAMNDRRSVGLYLCADLSCVEKARERPGTNDFDEGLSAEQRIQKIVARISAFAARRLF